MRLIVQVTRRFFHPFDGGFLELDVRIEPRTERLGHGGGAEARRFGNVLDRDPLGIGHRRNRMFFAEIDP